MPRRCLAVLLRAASIAVLSGSLACAHAVEIGEVMVRSYLGQPLVADIELTGFSADGTVDVRLAHPDVFQASNVGMHPVLPSLRMSVMRRDGRQFVHITSIAPVQTQYVHLFLDLRDGGRRNVRAASLPLVADPRPAPAVVAAPVIPAPIAVAPAPKPVVAEAPPKPVAKAAPKPAPPVMPVAAPAASCPKPRFSDDEIRACATRDYKNAMLSAQIVELEEKVKALQASLDGPAGVAPAPATVHQAVQVKAAPPQVRTAAVKKANPPADTPFPWAWIGAAVAALVIAAAGVVIFLKRRGKRTRVVVLPSPGGSLMGRLKDAMHRDKKPGMPAEPVEREKETVAG
jgi:pilus assembly protein FimV